MRNLIKIVGLAMAAGLLAGATAAHAQWKPDRPIKIIVPFAAGAATDISARTISDRIAATLGQPIVIENQGAASGVVGTKRVPGPRPMATHGHSPTTRPSPSCPTCASCAMTRRKTSSPWR